MSEQETNCCIKPDLVSNAQQVLFSIDNATHCSKKLVIIELVWCVNCNKTKFLSCLETVG